MSARESSADANTLRRGRADAKVPEPARPALVSSFESRARVGAFNADAIPSLEPRDAAENTTLRETRATRELTLERAPTRREERRYERARRFVEPDWSVARSSARRRSDASEREGGAWERDRSANAPATGSARLLESIEALLRESRDSLATIARGERGELTLVTGSGNY